METDEKRQVGKEAAPLSGGQLCNACGYQYSNPRPSAKLRRSHSKHCGKALPPAAAAEAVTAADEREEDKEIAAFGSSPSSAKLGMVDFLRSSFEEWAEVAESEDSEGSLMVPPVLIIQYRDLLTRAWGWERLLPRIHGSIDWDQYKTYLEEYYQHNADKAATSKETLRAAANLCISKERELVFACVSVFSMEDNRLSIKIKEHAMTVLESESEGEYRAAAAALLSISTEAELMFMLLDRGYGTSVITLGNKIRRSALNLMLYKGSEYAAASGAMMGIAKEAAIILDSARQNLFGAHTEYYDIKRLRESIAADLAVLEQELSYKTDGTLASGKTGEEGMELGTEV